MQINEDELKKARDNMCGALKELYKEERLLYLMLLAVVLRDQIEKTDCVPIKEVIGAPVIAHLMFEVFKKNNPNALEREIVTCFRENFTGKMLNVPKDERYINCAFLYYILNAVREFDEKLIIFKYQS